MKRILQKIGSVAEIVERRSYIRYHSDINNIFIHPATKIITGIRIHFEPLTIGGCRIVRNDKSSLSLICIIEYVEIHVGPQQSQFSVFRKGVYVDMLYDRFLRSSADPQSSFYQPSFRRKFIQITEIFVNIIDIPVFEDSGKAFVRAIDGIQYNSVQSNIPICNFSRSIENFSLPKACFCFITSCKGCNDQYKTEITKSDHSHFKLKVRNGERYSPLNNQIFPLQFKLYSQQRTFEPVAQVAPSLSTVQLLALPG